MYTWCKHRCPHGVNIGCVRTTTFVYIRSCPSERSFILVGQLLLCTGQKMSSIPIYTYIYGEACWKYIWSCLVTPPAPLVIFFIIRTPVTSDWWLLNTDCWLQSASLVSSQQSTVFYCLLTVDCCIVTVYSRLLPSDWLTSKSWLLTAS